MLLKPTRGLRLNKSHTLTRGLVSLWLMNEGSGNKVFDLSGNGNIGTLKVNTHFVPGKYGSALDFDGISGDYVDFAEKFKFNSNDEFTVSISFNSAQETGVVQAIIGKRRAIAGSWALWYIGSGGLLYFELNGDTVLREQISVAGVSANAWHYVSITYKNTVMKIYVDGVLKDEGAYTDSGNFDNNLFAIGKSPSSTSYFLGLVDHGMIYNRALSASEIALLYREPFCVFENPIRLDLVGSQIINLVGTTATLSSLSATAKTMRKVVGNVTSISDVEALLNSIRDRLETERNWLREALFNGMTANAFKLGTTLSLGWFWVRIGGCSALYRGSGMGEIDFVNVLAVAESEACEISGPSYIPHNSGSTYFYVIRRFNNCGYQEHTLAAAMKVSIDSNGNLAVSQPNNIFSSKVEQVNVNKIQLVWFYCPLEQQSQPVCFNVYYDDRTGQINYQDPLATIGYKGRKFYSHQTNALEAGKYLFAIRAEDANDIENSSLSRLRIHLDTTNLDAINILRAEAF